MLQAQIPFSSLPKDILICTLSLLTWKKEHHVATEELFASDLWMHGMIVHH
jgi:hypothetical protein